MNKLTTQLQRLYFRLDQPELRQQAEDDLSSQSFHPVGADGMVRTLLIKFARPGDWEVVARLYQALQKELDLPAPAISVSGEKGFRLWLSLTQPAPVAQAREKPRPLSGHSAIPQRSDQDQTCLLEQFQNFSRW